MALHIAHVHSPSDCDFCNRRTLGQSVPDLTLDSYSTSPSTRSLVPRSPRDTPVSSPLRTPSRPHRAKLARYRRATADPAARPRSSDMSKPDTPTADTPFRRRVYTMPSRPRLPTASSTDSDAYRLRSFSVTSRGDVVNLGDLVCFRSRSDLSEGSRSSLGDEFRDRASSSASTAPSTGDIPSYRVLVLGEKGVGKTSLIAQFMTSEYLTARNAIINDCHDFMTENTTVSILLDKEEADLECIESKNLMLSAEEYARADAILVTYSVTDAATFGWAGRCLVALREAAGRLPPSSLPLGPGLRSKAVILVANKCDLARLRAVSTDNGRSLASRFDVKFIETSVVIHHNVDQLLVGALSQVRLKARQAAALSCKRHAKFTSRAKNLWHRLLQKCEFRFNSCDNLYRL